MRGLESFQGQMYCQGLLLELQLREPQQQDLLEEGAGQESCRKGQEEGGEEEEEEIKSEPGGQ